jgi:hypothetical protein
MMLKPNDGLVKCLLLGEFQIFVAQASTDSKSMLETTYSSQNRRRNLIVLPFTLNKSADEVGDYGADEVSTLVGECRRILLYPPTQRNLRAMRMARVKGQSWHGSCTRWKPEFSGTMCDPQSGNLIL